MARIRRIRPEYRTENSCCLLHDSAPKHTFLVVRRFLAKNNVCVLNHPPYSPNLAPCDYLFSKLKRKLKRCYFEDISTLQVASTHALQAVPQSDLHNRTATAGSDVVQFGRPIFDDFFQHLWPYIGNNTANFVFQMVKRLWLIRIDQ
ncbi:mariner Mos1 transposase [Trichonephila clavipes]|nr:mariner Mos1 transposase [Trichonephila clavipes]